MALPDCMMPDGATPCDGFAEVYHERERLRTVIEQLRNALLWIDRVEPELVAAAETKFGFSLMGNILDESEGMKLTTIQNSEER